MSPESRGEMNHDATGEGGEHVHRLANHSLTLHEQAAMKS